MMNLWADKQDIGDSRIKALLAEEFTTEQRDTESQAEWDQKLCFWKDMVLRHCETQGRVTCNARELRAALAWNGLQPIGMPGVMYHMESKGEAVAVDRAARGDYGEPSLMKSTFRLMASPVKALKSWILSEEDGQAGTFKGQENTVVIMPVLQKWAGAAEKEFRAKGVTLLGRIVTRDEAAQFVAGLSSREEQDMVLDYLVKKKVLSSFRLENGIEGLRLLESGDRIESDTEKELLQLRLISDQLEREIASLESRENEIRDGISDALKKKQKQRAVGLLRISKQLSKFADSRRSQLMKIRSMTTSLEDAVLNTKTLDALVKGSQALGKVNNAICAGGDLDRRLAEMDSAMADAKDISDTIDAAMTAMGGAADDYDDDELSKELDDLMAADALEKLERLSVLPTVPVAPVAQDEPGLHAPEDKREEGEATAEMA